MPKKFYEERREVFKYRGVQCVVEISRWPCNGVYGYTVGRLDLGDLSVHLPVGAGIGRGKAALRAAIDLRLGQAAEAARNSTPAAEQDAEQEPAATPKRRRPSSHAAKEVKSVLDQRAARRTAEYAEDCANTVAAARRERMIAAGAIRTPETLRDRLIAAGVITQPAQDTCLAAYSLEMAATVSPY